MKIDDLLKLEQQNRRNQKWFMFSGEVINDKGNKIQVELKSFGFYNQILRINYSYNLCSGHTLNKVKDMHAFLRRAMNFDPIIQ